MARPVRVQFENAVYHVTARGTERKDIYRDVADRERFLETLEEAVERFGVVDQHPVPAATGGIQPELARLDAPLLPQFFQGFPLIVRFESYVWFLVCPSSRRLHVPTAR